MKSYTSILAGICIPVRLPSVPNDLTVRTEGSIARGQSLAQSFHLLWLSFRGAVQRVLHTVRRGTYLSAGKLQVDQAAAACSNVKLCLGCASFEPAFIESVSLLVR